MLIELPLMWLVLANLAGCAGIQLGFAWAFTRAPLKFFRPGRDVAWERGGRLYERGFRVKAWKHHLPDGATWFDGGFAKGNLGGSSPEYLQRFVCETWRGELCHWSVLACTPLFFLWNPWWGGLIIAAYALVANLPCIVVQRYNRLRFRRILARNAARDDR